MPYKRPVYQHQHQHQQQPQHNQHYQHRMMHSPGPTPYGNVFSTPQVRQNYLLQAGYNYPGALNQGYNGQTTGTMTGFNISHRQPPASRIINTTIMADDNSNNYDDAMPMKHEPMGLGCGGEGGGGGVSSASEHTSQNFPDEEYYCDDRPVYGLPNNSQVQQLPPGAFYQAHNQTMAMMSVDGRQYDSSAATSDFQANNDRVSVIPQSQYGAPRRRPDYYQGHYQNAPPGMMQQQQQQQHRQHIHQERTQYHKTPAELNSTTRRYEQQAPIYANHQVTRTNDFIDQYQRPTVSMSQDYIHRVEPMTNRQMDRYHSHYQVSDLQMCKPQEGEQLYMHACDEQQQQQQKQYTVQPEQLVRQEMGLNPRKISRVSASAITNPAVHSNYQSSPAHHINHGDQYPSGDTDTYRVVVSTSPDENVALQQPYPSTPFVESVSSDQTEEYSSFDSSTPVAPTTTRELSNNQLQDEQQQHNHHQQTIRQHHQQGANYIDMRSSGTVSQEWLDTICRHMIEHMNNFGICVIDNFLGSIKGEAILSEVLQLYKQRNYTTGRLVSDVRDDENNDEIGSNSTEKMKESAVALERQQKLAVAAADPARLIRNDRVIWVEGCEHGCSEINNLIQTLCSVITNSSRLSLYTGNALDKIVINKRTKAHVACYPGNRTRYIKHVDNPNNDGRVITAIYYLNKNWSTKRDGGLLRMFPAGMDTVANIEPLFDRVLFFWSDRRNPHEVLPAFRDRFAITVWYIASETTR